MKVHIGGRMIITMLARDGGGGGGGVRGLLPYWYTLAVKL